MVLLDGDDGGCDAGDRQFADGGINIAFKGSCRLGEMSGTPFPLLHFYHPVAIASKVLSLAALDSARLIRR